MLPNSDFPALYPDNLLDTPRPLESERVWHVMHTKSRQEKSLARELFQYEIPYYLPAVKQTKVYGRRKISSTIPVFPSYVFVSCTEEERVTCLTTKRIVRVLSVVEADRLQSDLVQLRRLIESGAPLTLESRLSPGARVRIKRGPFVGMEGSVIVRRGKRRVFVAVEFLQKGASVAVEDYMLESA